MMITITHTHADGTLVGGSVRGDGVYEILRGLHGHWRSFRSLGCLGLVQSRDKPAKARVINAAAEALRAAGHEVTVSVDDSDRRGFAEVEAERYERAGDRAERMSGRAERASAASAAAFRGVDQIFDAIPVGQPILVGHHSERRHRNALDRADRGMRRGLDEAGKAGHYERRADNAAGYQEAREDVPRTLRRIAKLEAEERLIGRRLAGQLDYIPDGAGGHKFVTVPPGERYRAGLERRAAALADELAHWRGVVDRQRNAGVKVWSREDFTRGDYALFRGTYYEVVRVNAKTVTIPAMINDGHIVHKDGNRCTWTDTVPYHELSGRKSADEIAAMHAEARTR